MHGQRQRQLCKSARSSSFSTIFISTYEKGFNLLPSPLIHLPCLETAAGNKQYYFQSPQWHYYHRKRKWFVPATPWDWKKAFSPAPQPPWPHKTDLGTQNEYWRNSGVLSTNPERKKTHQVKNLRNFLKNRSNANTRSDSKDQTHHWESTSDILQHSKYI